MHEQAGAQAAMAAAKGRYPMSDHQSRDPATNTALNPEDVAWEDKQRQLEGQQADDQQSALLDKSQVDTLDEATSTDLYKGETEPDMEVDMDELPADAVHQPESLTSREERAGETSDAFKAAEEGMTYIPPIDPATLPSDDFQRARIASGMGASAFAEEYDIDHHSSALPGPDEMRQRVYEALLADSSTNRYADAVEIEVREAGRQVILRGTVDDLVDSENLAAVAQYATGVTDVVDELRVKSMEATNPAAQR